jgi:sarcosine oxidase subunit gamma
MSDAVASQAVSVASVRPGAPSSRFILRGGAAVAEKAAEAFGVRLPTEPCRASVQGEMAALWLGPDEWLLLAPLAKKDHAAEALATALAGVRHALVEISDRNLGTDISGPRIADVLSAGCPLDVSEQAFPVGMCTRTIFNKAEIVLWRTSADQFHIETVRSFHPYVLGLLDLAIRDNT